MLCCVALFVYVFVYVCCVVFALCMNRCVFVLLRDVCLMCLMFFCCVSFVAYCYWHVSCVFMFVVPLFYRLFMLLLCLLHVFVFVMCMCYVCWCCCSYSYQELCYYVFVRM